ncbi:MAG: SAM-dependent DNA methyltransferase [Rubrivivax sp.]|nr:SAM-dependent DNA methyltransferase [Rubrivivax sp.]
MALKKSELYSSLWQSCDELRGGMDASQYKDYVLVLLFIKYVSDKYAGQPFAPITIPQGASFADMAALKGKPDIGDRINKQIVGPLAAANRLADMPDFNDATKLGSGPEMVDKLTNLIAIFENKALDFSNNRAEGDDILGDAYEYLMRHFATESGKSKGQFYTPAEVSRVIAQLLGIRQAKTSAATTVYDPTCGSGSLLLKVADEARTPLTLYGQEKDAATSGLARMNMILHSNPTALVEQGNTLADPKFLEGGRLKTFDYVVANPPFSDKRWSTGLDAANDAHERFVPFGIPPGKQGDYAYLLHIVRSLKSTGRAACILPHGVLFRGNAEADIRRALLQRGYIEALIGLPANLFYGTGIPACIVVVDKRHAHQRAMGAEGAGVFMVDASAGFRKDGPKNRLRAQDIHRIVDAFARKEEQPRYSRFVPLAEIERNGFNLNLPRYIDASVPEDMQDIAGHLQGGIPLADVQALQHWWAVCPALEAALFKPNRAGYVDLAVDDKAAIKATIHGHPQFVALREGLEAHFAKWRTATAKELKSLKAPTATSPGFHPKELIARLGESLLEHFQGRPLVDPYGLYQHVMDFWDATMQDDAYLVAADGWRAVPARVLEEKKNKEGEVVKTVDRGWACDLVPKALIVAKYFATEQAEIDALAAKIESTAAELAELEEEHAGDDGAFGAFDNGKVNAAGVKERLDEIATELGKSRPDDDTRAEIEVLKRWLALNNEAAALKKKQRDAEVRLDRLAHDRYATLAEADAKALVVDDKWLPALDAALHAELDRASRQLTQRVKELAERYETPMGVLAARVAELEGKVAGHLERMGFAWQ